MTRHSAQRFKAGSGSGVAEGCAVPPLPGGASGFYRLLRGRVRAGQSLQNCQGPPQGAGLARAGISALGGEAPVAFSGGRIARTASTKACMLGRKKSQKNERKQPQNEELDLTRSRWQNGRALAGQFWCSADQEMSGTARDEASID